MIEVAYTLNNGEERIGSLIRENVKTILVHPFRWIKSRPILVHKIKNKAKVIHGNQGK